MNFLAENLETYVQQHSEQEPDLLQELARETHLKVLQPRMLSGAYQGRLLSLISKLIKPKHILEIGTFTGYSALCMAEGLHENGRIDTIDVDEELTDLQRRYFDASSYGKQIFQHLGNAADIIPTLNGNFDLVFIDADKEQYPLYFDLIIDRVQTGGLIIADNVLWSGKVVTNATDEATQTLQQFNKKVVEDTRVETVLLPVRDGLTLMRKT
ncbi:MAG: O-methyltransferase [Bacteroidetes bacterium]|nr:O-methyltransferase [Bacteroidota bacterium]MDA0888397.1 O-methyltransferase [Bacteroidota bacterium]MDA1084457.1 O-methyltransferase [Bacteroidota bacterium]